METAAVGRWLGGLRRTGLRPTREARGDLQTAKHEFGHVLGTSWPYHRIVRVRPAHDGSFVFAGAHALAANAGEPGPPEGDHAGSCPSVMTYRDCTQRGPSDLDFGMLRDLGYEMFDPPEARPDYPMDAKTQEDCFRATALSRRPSTTSPWTAT